ncbi:MAG: class I SAM-dependent methyltransferase [Pirellulales bacterium]|nr:class I SAM-dependent methyltransferase [Pirellulales bacterium]
MTLRHVLVDLGTTPLCESYLSAEQLAVTEPVYPLTVFVCENCLLAQVPEYVNGEAIFSHYAYFSSYSESYLDHARRNTESLIKRFRITPLSWVVELASNDGYLLRNFVERGIPCLGVEPAANIAQVAQRNGVPTLDKFFGEQTARDLVAQGRRADLLLANNVLAHVPDLNDFVRGMKLLLAADGVAVIEVQHLLRLIEGNQFDTIYHEHFCYFTLLAFERVLASHGLTIFDVDEISTHGGSLRFYVKHRENSRLAIHANVSQVADYERRAGLYELAGYRGFAEKTAEVKRRLLDFLINARRAGHSVAGYGAPGKGNTLLNYCGIGRDLLSYTVDRNPYKQGKFLPGSRIPIFAPQRISETRPDFVLILPWNLKDEIAGQLAYVREWGGRLVTPIPELQVW